MDHFMISAAGDVTEPDGYSPSMSMTLMTLTYGLSPEFRARVLSQMRGFLNFRMTQGETPRAVLEEPAAASVDRVCAYLRAIGVPVLPSKKPNREHEFELKVPEGKSTVHAGQIVATLRQFYQLAGSFKVGSRTSENPMEEPGWHEKDEDQRRESWNTRHPKRPYGWINAGLRFRTDKRKAYLPLIEDPTGCAEKMTLAVIKYQCPQTVIAICMVLEENGCRWREAAWANALGWSVLGFGDTCYTTNKFDSREHAKKIVLNPGVLSETIRNFESAPHPTDPKKTMMDHLRELSEAGDKEALRAIPLFPNSRGTFHQHRTFNGYWFRPAMEAWLNEDGSNGLLIHSDLSARRPTPHWYRHAEITRVLEQAVVGCEDYEEVLEVCKKVCRTFSLESDQARRYAACLLRRLAEEANMRRVAARRAGNEALRKGVNLQVAISRLEISEGERLLLSLPSRHKVPA